MATMHPFDPVSRGSAFRSWQRAANLMRGFGPPTIGHHIISDDDARKMADRVFRRFDVIHKPGNLSLVFFGQQHDQPLDVAMFLNFLHRAQSRGIRHVAFEFSAENLASRMPIARRLVADIDREGLAATLYREARNLTASPETFELALALKMGLTPVAIDKPESLWRHSLQEPGGSRLVDREREAFMKERVLKLGEPCLVVMHYAHTSQVHRAMSNYANVSSVGLNCVDNGGPAADVPADDANMFSSRYTRTYALTPLRHAFRLARLLRRDEHYRRAYAPDYLKPPLPQSPPHLDPKRLRERLPPSPVIGEWNPHGPGPEFVIRWPDRPGIMAVSSDIGSRVQLIEVADPEYRPELSRAAQAAQAKADRQSWDLLRQRDTNTLTDAHTQRTGAARVKTRLFL